MFCPKAEAEGLTIIARSGETAEMMGPCLPKISLSSAFRDGLLEWEVQSDVRYPCPVGYCVPEWPVGEGRRVAASLSLPGVAERFAGQGIAQRLVAECVANGAHEGYRVAVTEATNRTSQHVFRKQAWSSAWSGPTEITGSSARLSLHRSPNEGGRADG